MSKLNKYKRSELISYILSHGNYFLAPNENSYISFLGRCETVEVINDYSIKILNWNKKYFIYVWSEKGEKVKVGSVDFIEWKEFKTKKEAKKHLEEFKLKWTASEV